MGLVKQSSTLVASVVAGVILLVSLAQGDVIQLKDGTRLEGEIRKTGDGWIIVVAGGGTKTVSAESVASIESRPKAGGDISQERLYSLRRAVENTADIKQIVTRFKAFADQYPGTPAAESARSDMKLWQDRLDRRLVKVGDQWVTADEKLALIDKSNADAGEALHLIKQSKLREASPLLDQILAENPQNAAAWYLRGFLLLRQDQLVPARKAFESAIGILPDHAPSLNNIAVICWRQNQPVVALNFYDRALAAAPNRRDILDNIAEALNALPEENREALITRKLVRHFNEQDAAMQVMMQKQGLYRWGATWVSGSDLDKLKAAESAIKDKLDRMSGDFDAVTARITRIDAEIDADSQLAKRLEIESYGRDPQTGVAVRYPLPPTYFDMIHDLKLLHSEREARVMEQEKMRTQAKVVRQSLPSPKYTGLQRAIDADGAPVSAAVLAGAVAPPVAVTVAPPAPPSAPAPAALPATAPVTQPVQVTPAAVALPPLPQHTVIPPEKPSILDRPVPD